MAAAEYFSNAPMSHSSQTYQQHPQAPTSYPAQHQPTPPINTYQPSPNYQQGNTQHNVHFAPPPAELPQRHSFSGHQRPSFSGQSGYSNNPYHNSHQHLAPHPRPQQYGSPHSTGSNSPHQRPQYLAPHMRPYANPNSSQYALENGYSSDPEPNRRKHKQRRRAASDDKRPKDTRAKNTDGLLGAAGGGLIGDLIFPGLGTVGGAALGFIGGRDYGKHRKDREQQRVAEQRDWEEKFRPNMHHRDRSYDHRSRDASSHSGDHGRRRSYERRKDDY